MRSLRAINLMLLLALIATVVATYTLKHNAEVTAANISHLQTAIVTEKDKMRALNAEWAALNQPSRLEAVVKEHADYFDLQPFSPDQLGSIDEIPLRFGTNAPPAVGDAAVAGGDMAAVKATLARIAAGGALRAH